MKNKTHTLVTIVALLIIGSLFIIFPLWNVWRRELSGKAQLREAGWNKKVLIEEAKAKKEV